MKKRIMPISVVVFLVFVTACDPVIGPKVLSLPSDSSALRYGDGMGLRDRRELLERFVTDRLSGSDGVYTNYLDTDQNAEAATGHEVLSESAGLLLRYAALTGQRQLFDREWATARRVFDMGTGFSYRYSPKLDKRYASNAAVDDLRIIRALSEAGESFGDETYAEEAKAYGKRFYQYNVVNGGIRDFYDANAKAAGSSVTLCYIDLASLQLLPLSEEEREKLSGRMLDIVQGGYISDRLPLYRTSYSYETQRYSPGPINTVESLLTILSLAEAGLQKQESIRFLRSQLEHGPLYGRYAEDGSPANDLQSTAIYALTALIGAATSDRDLYEASIRRMETFRVLDASSPLYGGFGDAGSGQAYSFDNLLALMAYAS